MSVGTVDLGGGFRLEVVDVYASIIYGSLEEFVVETVFRKGVSCISHPFFEFDTGPGFDTLKKVFDEHTDIDAADEAVYNFVSENFMFFEPLIREKISSSFRFEKVRETLAENGVTL